MYKNQKLPNSRWIAHDSKTSEVFQDTLHTSLNSCKSLYILENILGEYQILNYENYLASGRDGVSYLLDNFEHLIPSNVHFTIVSLEPKWETTVKGGCND